MTANNPDASRSRRDPQTGRFLTGNSGGGRPKGSRNKLAGEFIDALYAEFQTSGPDAIKRVAEKEPAKFLRLIAELMPKEIDVAIRTSLFEDARDFLEAFRMARQFIGAETVPPMIELNVEKHETP
jgi:hypothetical protein